jgi:putative transposase
MLARFVEHVLPPRFVKIRHYGLHAASHATTRLELAPRRLDPAAPTPPHLDDSPATLERLLRPMGIDVRLCPACHAPALVRTPVPEPEAR